MMLQGPLSTAAGSLAQQHLGTKWKMQPVHKAMHIALTAQGCREVPGCAKRKSGYKPSPMLTLFCQLYCLLHEVQEVLSEQKELTQTKQVLCQIDTSLTKHSYPCQARAKHGPGLTAICC